MCANPKTLSCFCGTCIFAVHLYAASPGYPNHPSDSPVFIFEPQRVGDCLPTKLKQVVRVETYHQVWVLLENVLGHFWQDN